MLNFIKRFFTGTRPTKKVTQYPSIRDLARNDPELQAATTELRNNLAKLKAFSAARPAESIAQQPKASVQVSQAAKHVVAMNQQPPDATVTKNFEQAVAEGDLDRIKKLLAQWPTLVFSRGYEDATPLHEAAFRGHLDVVKLLLSSGGDIDARNEKGMTGLHKAVYGNTTVAEFLLSSGADVNSRDKIGKTPLHEAAICGEELGKDMAKLLLSHGAAIRATDQRGRTPIGIASQYEHAKAVEDFLRLRLKTHIDSL